MGPNQEPPDVKHGCVRFGRRQLGRRPCRQLHVQSQRADSELSFSRAVPCRLPGDMSRSRSTPYILADCDSLDRSTTARAIAAVIETSSVWPRSLEATNPNNGAATTLCPRFSPIGRDQAVAGCAQVGH